MLERSRLLLPTRLVRYLVRNGGLNNHCYRCLSQSQINQMHPNFCLQCRKPPAFTMRIPMRIIWLWILNRPDHGLSV